MIEYNEALDKVYDLLSKKYNIIDRINFLDFDPDFENLKSRLQKLRKEKFDENDIILVKHLDTDFYFEYCSVGINLLNFFTVVEMVDIPKSVFLFYTHHFGIQREIEQICKNEKDRPKIIESFIDNLHYNVNGYQDVDLNVDQIKHQCLCMMNMIRSHRNALYRSVKDISDDKMIKSFTINKND